MTAAFSSPQHLLYFFPEPCRTLSIVVSIDDCGSLLRDDYSLPGNIP
jgi:hypothetical protein